MLGFWDHTYNKSVIIYLQIEPGRQDIIDVNVKERKNTDFKDRIFLSKLFFYFRIEKKTCLINSGYIIKQ